MNHGLKGREIVQDVDGFTDNTKSAAELGELLRKNSLTVSCAESCTGGLLTGCLTEIAGSSEYVAGSVVSYTNAVKNKILGVKQSTLDEYGAVSEHTAREMAEGVRALIGSDIGIGVTGNAGPGASENKPVGLVYISVAGRKGTVVRENIFSGNRAVVRQKAVSTALAMIKEYIAGV